MTTPSKRRNTAIAEASDKQKERFWDNTVSEGKCVVSKSKSADGYACLQLGGVYVRGNRAALIWATGLKHAHLYALHRCHNRGCVRVDHLYWGDAQDNHADMKNEWDEPTYARRGVASRSAKLCDESVRNIWQLFYEKHKSLGYLSRQFGISRTTIQRIVSGRTWLHITRHLTRGPMPAPIQSRAPKTPSAKPQASDLRGESSYNAKLSKEQALQVFRSHYEQGARQCDLARLFRVSTGTVQAILKRRSWAEETKNLIGGPAYKSRPSKPVRICHPRSKLSDEQVKEIWHLYYVEKVSGTALAKQFAVFDTIIYNILRRQTYLRVTANLTRDESTIKSARSQFTFYGYGVEKPKRRSRARLKSS